MDISIIIAHYCNDQSAPHYNSFLKTINTIQEQAGNYNVEIIIADDGSNYSKDIIQKNSKIIEIDNDPRKLFILEDKLLDKWLDTLEIKNKFISKWLYIPKLTPCMSKARLWNFASLNAKSECLFFLDDDNYFISSHSIDSINNLSKKYDIIFGQIKDSSGKFRLYSSNRVQGTTFGLKKQILKSIGGFGQWTEKISCGIDSDLWIKLFNYSKKNNTKACYTNKIQTYDSCSKRWKKYTKIFKDYNARREFMSLYGIKNYKSVKNNPSRDKSLWIDNLIR